MRPAESFISQPVRSLQTMLRVIAESDSSLPTVVPDGIYGQETIQAVNAFQLRQSIPATGITDQETWEAIVAAYEEALVLADAAVPIEVVFDPGKVFKYNERSPYLYLVQSMLLVLSQRSPNIMKPNHTGILDQATSDALISFQRIAGLVPSGDLDRITWKNLVSQFTLEANRGKTVEI